MKQKIERPRHSNVPEGLSPDDIDFKIVVPTERDKEGLKSTLRYLHDQDIDTDFVWVNHLVHGYLSDSMIVVDPKAYDAIGKKD